MHDSHTQLWKFTPSAPFLVILLPTPPPPPAEKTEPSLFLRYASRRVTVWVQMLILPKLVLIPARILVSSLEALYLHLKIHPCGKWMQFHRCRVAVTARVKPYTVLILSPNSEKWVGIIYKVKGLHFIDLLEFILFFLHVPLTTTLAHINT